MSGPAEFVVGIVKAFGSGQDRAASAGAIDQGVVRWRADPEWRARLNSKKRRKLRTKVVLAEVAALRAAVGDNPLAERHLVRIEELLGGLQR